MNLIHEMKQDKAFLKKAAMIAIPIALQGLLNNVLNFVDTLMISRLDTTTVAAVGIANKIFFIVSLLLFGICSGSSILTSQYWGMRDMKNIKRVVGLSMLLGVTSAFLFSLVSFLKPQFVMSIFTNNEPTIIIGAKYLKIVCISYVITAVTQIFMSALRSVNQVKLPVVISCVAIVTNVILNYVLIFGKFGFPELGVEGAAIATLIARIVEVAAMVLLVYYKKSPASISMSHLFFYDKDLYSIYFRTASPVIMNEFMWGLGITMYSLVYGRMGDNAMAAITITQNIEQLLQVVFMGISNATAVILGNELGAGKLKDAETHAKFILILQTMVTVIIIALGIIFMNPLIAVFQMEPVVSASIRKCLFVFLTYLFFKVFNTVNIVGILRSGGDTKAALFLDVTGVWLIGIPMAFLGGLVFHFPIEAVYAMVLSEEIYKMVLGFPRYRKKKWLRKIVA
ncbi:MATE family efflux transporter [Lachnoclostridium sp.]|uniref:MATE family efflux transporter n=1 Tax=Lachnoclostridium sp. TaxID=2028282 RepID=UPI0028A126FA|nr:MATE family efflux transporter [Lachnoclostridium sp.]